MSQFALILATLFLFFSPHLLISLRSYIKHPKECFIRYPNTSRWLNPLNPNIKIQFLLSCPHTFIIAVVGRNCENFKRIHIEWSYLKFSWSLWWLRHWHQKEKFHADPLLGLKGLKKKNLGCTLFSNLLLGVWKSWWNIIPRTWYITM